jgi:DNA (cytosine-5)-methyltransferase 1
VTAKTIYRWERGETAPPKAIMEWLAERALAAPVPMPNWFTFVDLFAGIGGLRLGFQDIGGRCVFTSEWDKYAQQTYRANFGSYEDIAGDITLIESAGVPSHDVLLAGFPCQPFSIAGVSKKNALGRPHGFACDAQGTLFFEVARLIDHHRPKAFLLENVKNLRTHDAGRTFDVIMRTLTEELGYAVDYRIIDARAFVPQHRERIIIVGFSTDVGFSMADVHVPAAEDGPRLGSILHNEDGSDEPEPRYLDVKGRVLDKYTLTPRLWRYLQDYAAKHRAKGNGFGYGLVGRDDVARTLSARYYKDGSEILVDQGPKQVPRRLTPRECARLMGFDRPGKTFRIPVSDTQAYRQFGNSVVVPVIQAVAHAMLPYLKTAVRTDRDQLTLPLANCA